MLTHIRDMMVRQVDPDRDQKLTNTGEWSGPRNLADWAERIVLDILSDLAFGKSFCSLKQPTRFFAI